MLKGEGVNLDDSLLLTHLIQKDKVGSNGELFTIGYVIYLGLFIWNNYLVSIVWTLTAKLQHRKLGPFMCISIGHM